jgi:hypothetical protein
VAASHAATATTGGSSRDSYLVRAADPAPHSDATAQASTPRESADYASRHWTPVSTSPFDSRRWKFRRTHAAFDPEVAERTWGGERVDQPEQREASTAGTRSGSRSGRRGRGDAAASDDKPDRGSELNSRDGRWQNELADEDPSLPEELETGCLIWEGEYLPPPYVIAVEGENWIVNGKLLPPLADSSLAAPPAENRPRRWDEKELEAARRSPAALIRQALEEDGLLLVEADKTHVLNFHDAFFVLSILRNEPDSELAREQLVEYFSSTDVPGHDADWSS